MNRAYIEAREEKTRYCEAKEWTIHVYDDYDNTTIWCLEQPPLDPKELLERVLYSYDNNALETVVFAIDNDQGIMIEGDYVEAADVQKWYKDWHDKATTEGICPD